MNNKIQRLELLAGLFDEFGQALFFKCDNGDEELEELMAFAAMRRFDLLARDYYLYLAEKFELPTHELVNVVEAVVTACIEKGFFNPEELAQLGLMADLLCKIHTYHDEEYIEQRDFVQYMHKQYAFLRKVLATEFQYCSTAANPFYGMEHEQ